jgi:hypothetical protein
LAPQFYSGDFPSDIIRIDKRIKHSYTSLSTQNTPTLRLSCGLLFSKRVAQTELDKLPNGQHNSYLTADYAVAILSCQHCEKPRVVYQSPLKAGSPPEQVKAFLDEMNEARADIAPFYFCGKVIVGDESNLFPSVFIRRSRTCSAPVEQQYYAFAAKKGLPARCCLFCGSQFFRVEEYEEALKLYGMVYPRCTRCAEAKNDLFCRRQKSVARRSQTNPVEGFLTVTVEEPALQRSSLRTSPMQRQKLMKWPMSPHRLYAARTQR